MANVDGRRSVDRQDRTYSVDDIFQMLTREDMKGSSLEGVFTGYDKDGHTIDGVWFEFAKTEGGEAEITYTNKTNGPRKITWAAFVNSMTFHGLTSFKIDQNIVSKAERERAYTHFLEETVVNMARRLKAAESSELSVLAEGLTILDFLDSLRKSGDLSPERIEELEALLTKTVGEVEAEIVISGEVEESEVFTNENKENEDPSPEVVEIALTWENLSSFSVDKRIKVISMLMVEGGMTPANVIDFFSISKEEESKFRAFLGNYSLSHKQCKNKEAFGTKTKDEAKEKAKELMSEPDTKTARVIVKKSKIEDLCSVKIPETGEALMLVLWAQVFQKFDEGELPLRFYCFENVSEQPHSSYVLTNETIKPFGAGFMGISGQELPATRENLEAIGKVIVGLDIRVPLEFGMPEGTEDTKTVVSRTEDLIAPELDTPEKKEDLFSVEWDSIAGAVQAKAFPVRFYGFRSGDEIPRFSYIISVDEIEFFGPGFEGELSHSTETSKDALSFVKQHVSKFEIFSSTKLSFEYTKDVAGEQGAGEVTPELVSATKTEMAAEDKSLAAWSEFQALEKTVRRRVMIILFIEAGLNKDEIATLFSGRDFTVQQLSQWLGNNSFGVRKAKQDKTYKTKTREVAIDEVKDLLSGGAVVEMMPEEIPAQPPLPAKRSHALKPVKSPAPVPAAPKVERRRAVVAKLISVADFEALPEGNKVQLLQLIRLEAGVQAWGAGDLFGKEGYSSDWFRNQLFTRGFAEEGCFPEVKRGTRTKEDAISIAKEWIKNGFPKPKKVKEKNPKPKADEKALTVAKEMPDLTEYYSLPDEVTRFSPEDFDQAKLMITKFFTAGESVPSVNRSSGKIEIIVPAKNHHLGQSKYRAFAGLLFHELTMAQEGVDNEASAFLRENTGVELWIKDQLNGAAVKRKEQIGSF